MTAAGITFTVHLGMRRWTLFIGTVPREVEIVTGYAVATTDDEDIPVWFICIPGVGGLAFGLSETSQD